MQSAKDWIGMDGKRLSAAMARFRMRVGELGERRIGNTGTRRHMVLYISSRGRPIGRFDRYLFAVRGEMNSPASNICGSQDADRHDRLAANQRTQEASERSQQIEAQAVTPREKRAY
jgi:hypothetical protein